MKEKGLSLLEMIIVLVILSISVSLVSPSLLKLLNTIEFKSNVKKISSLLRYYRTEAVNKGETYQITFNLESKIIKIKSSESGEKSSLLLPEGIIIKEININFLDYDSSNPTIEFYPNGRSNGASILFSNGVKNLKLIIHPITGIVRVMSEDS